jgi:hypothetical protein
MKKHIHIPSRVGTRIGIHSAVFAMVMLLGAIAEAASK